MKENLSSIDHAALRANQYTIIILSVLAFVLNLTWLPLFIGLVMLNGALIGIPGFLFIYRYGLKPAGWMKPEIIPDNPEPHRFAQGLGSVFMLAAALLLWIGSPFAGWGLVWLVVALAALNAFAGFCAGCMLYYWLSRWHVPGFSKNPPTGVIPGMRPARITGTGGEHDA